MTTPEIARLNPFDGLFLRAVHLQQIQLYTQALARALGAAGDPGVVYGYGVALAAAAGESAASSRCSPAWPSTRTAGSCCLRRPSRWTCPGRARRSSGGST